jgi:hypothetical protein
MFSLGLASFWSTAGLCAVAFLVARSAPAPEAPARWPTGPFLGLSFSGDPAGRSAPLILDLDTGAATPCTLPGAPRVDLLGCSPGRDLEGQFHLVVRGSLDPSRWTESGDEPYELTLYSFPGGRFLDRVGTAAAPLGPVSWCPARSDCILFAGADGRLYLHTFASGRTPARRPPPREPRPLRWLVDPPGGGPVHISDPCWPAGSEMAGEVLVAMTCDEDQSARGRGPHLWWLTVDPESATITASDRALEPDRTGPTGSDWQERLPCLGRAPDGTRLLAYLRRNGDQSCWDLEVVALESSGPDGDPGAVPSTRRRLAQGCIGLALAFSADGRTIYVSRRTPNDRAPWGTLVSVPVPVRLGTSHAKGRDGPESTASAGPPGGP